MANNHDRPLTQARLTGCILGALFVALSLDAHGSSESRIQLGGYRIKSHSVPVPVMPTPDSAPLSTSAPLSPIQKDRKISVFINLENGTKMPLLIRTFHSQETPTRIKGTYQPPIEESIDIQEDYISHRDPFGITVQGVTGSYRATCAFDNLEQKNHLKARFYFQDKQLHCKSQ